MRRSGQHRHHLWRPPIRRFASRRRRERRRRRRELPIALGQGSWRVYRRVHRRVYWALSDHEQRCPNAATTIRFLAAIGKLMLGTLSQVAPLVVTTDLPVSPSTALS